MTSRKKKLNKNEITLENMVNKTETPAALLTDHTMFYIIGTFIWGALIAVSLLG